MSVPRLPPEVVDLVLSYLQTPHDSKTLKASTLVCSEWFPIARQHLFSVLNVREDGTPNCDSVHFLHVVRLSPGIRMAVKHLRIKGPSTSHAIPFDSLFTLLHELPHLQHLTLHRMMIPSHLGENLPQLSLRKLTLRYVSDEMDESRRCSSMFQFLDLFVVEQLNMLFILWYYPFMAPPRKTVSATPISSTFKAFRVQASFSAAQCLEFLCFSPNLNAVTELDIRIDSFNLLISLGSLVDEQGCAIRTLKLRFTEKLSVYERHDWMDFQNIVQRHLQPPLHALLSLKSFHLVATTLSNASPFWGVFPAFFRALPTTLTEFHLCCASSPFPVEIPQFDQLIHGYPNLTDIYVHSPCGEAMEKDMRSSQSGKTFHCID